MMDASQCDSKRSGWQGLTAGRWTALGASVAAESAAALVAATMAVVAVFATVAALLAAITALVSRRLTTGLTARLAVPRVALIPLETASASAPAAAAAIGALLRIFALAAGLTGGLGLRRGGGTTAEELFHPFEETA